MRRLALALGLVASVVLLGPGCRQTRPEGDVVAVTNSPLNLDPGVGADEASQKAHQLLFSTLGIDDDLRIVPELAESIEQPDSRTYVARLRRGVVFHNGRELWAEDGGLASVAIGIVPPMSWAFEPDVFTLRHDPAQARRPLDAAGFPDPDGDGPRPRFRLTLKTSTSEVYRVQAGTIQHDLADAGIAVDIKSSEFQTLFTDVVRGNCQLFTLQFVGVTDPDMLRRVFHSRQAPPAGLNRVYYSNPHVDEPIDAATRAVADDERRVLYASAKRLMAEDIPYIGLWYKTNVAVFQPDITGMRWSPIADVTFLKDLREGPVR